MFLSISQIEISRHTAAKKQGRKGNTNFIVSSESQTAEPHEIIHAPISQITVETKRKKGKRENRISFVLHTQKESMKEILSL